MKIVNPADQEYIRQSVESVTEDVVRDLPSLARGEAIVVGSAIKLPVPVKIRARTTSVGGGDIDIVGEWNAD
jgi:DNA helicase HerA-like ATPase